MQGSLKLVNNGLYGLLGFAMGLLYYEPLAISITATARHATKTMNRIISE